VSTFTAGRGEKRHQPGIEADALAYQVEYRLTAHGGDATGHLAVDDDADRGEHRDPQQRITKAGAGSDGERELADLDEATHRRQDAEKELEKIRHPLPDASWTGAKLDRDERVHVFARRGSTAASAGGVAARSRNARAISPI